MNSTDRVRRADAAEFEALQAIERAAGALFPPGRIPDVDDVMPLGELAAAQDLGLLFVATAQDRVVGFAMAQERGELLHLAVMAVHPEHGRRGLGRQLVQAIVGAAARRRCVAVTLTTFDDLPWNGPFYRGLGFRALREAELDGPLRAILAHERSLGMTDRVAMRLEIGT